VGALKWQPFAFNDGIKWQKPQKYATIFSSQEKPRANLTRPFRQRKGVMNVPEALLSLCMYI